MKKYFVSVLLFVSLSFSQSVSTNFGNDILGLVFQNVAADSVGSVAGLQPASAPDSLYVSLLSASATKAGTQATNEITYTGYNRIGVYRNNVKWVVSGDSVWNADTLTFPACTGGSATAEYFSIGSYRTGNGKVLFFGQLSPSLSISTGVQPKIAPKGIVSTVN